MADVNLQRTSFASGETAPNVRAANDLVRYQSGAEKVENLVVTLEGILTRRSGTRFIIPLKNEAEKGKMLPFRYSGSDYYTLAFNGGKMRVLKDGGFLGAPYELTVPWVEADMENLRQSASGNVIIQVCGKKPQKLTRNDHTDWTITQYRPQNGPCDSQNLDASITIRASAVVGNGITLTGAGNPFKAGHVDGVFKLAENSQAIVSLWQANENIALTTESVSGGTGYIGDTTNPSNAFDGNTGTSATKASATTAWCGRTVSPASTILSAKVRMSAPVSPSGGTMTLQLWGKNGTPANDTDGVQLAQISFDVDLEGGADHTLTSSDASGTYTNQWVKAIYSGSATGINFAEITLTRLASSSPPVLRRWQDNVYQALTAGNTGVNAPVHTDGDVAAGTGSVTWRYLHSGYGFVQITAYTNGNSVTGNVISRLPDSVTSTPTYRWAPPSWCDAVGWPKTVSVHDQRMHFQLDNIYFETKPTTIDDFELTAADDSAIQRRLISNDGSFVELQWAQSSGILVQGARDQEWLTRAPGNFDALTAASVRDVPDQSEGSAAHIPAFVDSGTIFIGRSRKRLHYIEFDRLSERLTTQELSEAASHILAAKVMRIVWQRDPHRLAWLAMADGTLASCTFRPSQKLLAFTRHPMVNCFVEDLCATAPNDDGESQVVLQTRRTINNQTRRFYELLMPFFEPRDRDNPTSAGAWFVDCGLSYQGPPLARVMGADHLIGQTVAVFVDGAEQTRKVVANDGGVDLDGIDLTGPNIEVVVGLPIAWKMRDLPRDIVVQNQSSKGQPKRASHFVVEVRNSMGGQISFNGSTPNDLIETGTADYGKAHPLTTGMLTPSLASATQDEGVVELTGDNAYPFTLLAITPKLEMDEAS